MRTIVAAALLCLVIALMLPLLFAGGGQAAPEASAEPESAAGGLDSELSFTVLTANGVETVTMSDWLPGVVAGEMPALFEEEALKAQAVAARTYIMYSMGREKPAHPEADVCDDPACCKAHSTDEALREKWGESCMGELGYSAVGAVVGATYPKQLGELRAALPHTFFLVPGYGAQGGGAKDVAPAFDEKGLGAIVNASRSILCAWQKTGAAQEDFAKAAAAEAIRMRDDILSEVGGIRL